MDIGIVQFVDQLEYSSVQLVSADPRVISVSGPDMRTARDVYVNGVVCPQIHVISQTTLLAELPDAVVTQVTSLVVRSSAPTLTAAATDVMFTMSERPAAVSGMSALVQRALKLLTTTDGTDKIGGTSGGSLLSLCGTLSADRGTLAADVSNAIQAVSEYMQSDPNILSLPRNEQLSEMNLLTAEWDRDAQRANIQIEIVNMLGERTVSQFGT
jgi:hypothetical protein